jgi:hypothetical protein
MHIEIAEHARMSERGSSLLRLIQNNDMPILDLLVRESVQNSMDAAKTNAEFVQVDFSLSKFNKDELLNKLEGVDDAIRHSFPNKDYDCLKIKDSNTFGLTGPLHIDEVYDDNYGNLLKLIYEISMPQSKQGAGGSWGLGKTVYFRVGIGLVFYYSRIQLEDGTYESRLAACMVEDETKEKTFIPRLNGKPKRGIAWWGKKVRDNSTMPLTDENEINRIIDIFNVAPYSGNETGTTIIIPFIDKEKIMPVQDKEKADLIWWKSDLEPYLQVALQRWYAPRLGNVNYQYGNWLKALVNGKELKPKNMEPVFQIIQALYNRTTFNNEELARDILTDIPHHVKKINLRKDLDKQLAGKVAYVKVGREALQMNPPYNNKPPFGYVNLNESSEQNNPPLISYVRKPGMIVSYETTGRWTASIEKTIPTEYIIGIFVPNSENQVNNMNEKITLEEYLRKSEKADHTSWSDINTDGKNRTLVYRIQSAVGKAISESYSTKQKNTETVRNGALSRSLAQYLLPPENFGNKGTSPDNKKPGKENVINRRKKAQLIIEDNVKYNADSIEIEFAIHLSKSVSDCLLEVHVLSESGGIRGDSWEDEKVIGTQFPIELSNLKINSLNNEEANISINSDQIIKIEGLQMQLLNTKRFAVVNAIKITSYNNSDCKINGCLSLTKKDDFVQGTIVMTHNEVVKI